MTAPPQGPMGAAPSSSGSNPVPDGSTRAMNSSAVVAPMASSQMPAMPTGRSPSGPSTGMSGMWSPLRSSHWATASAVMKSARAIFGSWACWARAGPAVKSRIAPAARRARAARPIVLLPRWDGQATGPVPAAPGSGPEGLFLVAAVVLEDDVEAVPTVGAEVDDHVAGEQVLFRRQAAEAPRSSAALDAGDGLGYLHALRVRLPSSLRAVARLHLRSEHACGAGPAARSRCRPRLPGRCSETGRAVHGGRRCGRRGGSPRRERLGGGGLPGGGEGGRRGGALPLAGRRGAAAGPGGGGGS